MNNQRHDVFISYLQNDRDFVHRLVRDLESNGISVFFDQRAEPGASWADSISEAIENSDFLLVILSPDYIEASWAQEEMKVGLLLEAEGKSTVIPVLAEKCDLPPIIAAKTYANFAEDYEVGLKQLIPVLRKSIPADAEELTPGKLISAIDPETLEVIQKQLRKAVDFFRSPPKTVITERGDAKAKDNKKCFVVMPFCNEDLQIVYEDVVRPVICDSGLARKIHKSCTHLACLLIPQEIFPQSLGITDTRLLLKFPCETNILRNMGTDL